MPFVFRIAALNTSIGQNAQVHIALCIRAVQGGVAVPKYGNKPIIAVLVFFDAGNCRAILKIDDHLDRKGFNFRLGIGIDG